MSQRPQPLYKVVFSDRDKIYEVYAKQVAQGNMFGFVEIEELVFGEKSGLLVDPAEEKIKAEFAGVKRSYIPLHSIMRIDEVAERGDVKVRDVEHKTSDNVTPFPVYTPGSK